MAGARRTRRLSKPVRALLIQLKKLSDESALNPSRSSAERANVDMASSKSSDESVYAHLG